MKSLILHVQKIRFVLPAVLLLFFQQGVYADTNRPENLERIRVSWSVSRQNEQVTIQWKLHAASHINIIEIERTSDQKLHLSVDTLPGQKIRNYTIRYTFSELSVPAENVWFRLKMTDTHKKISYTPYLLYPAEKITSRLHILPSPSNGEELHLLFEQPLKYDIDISIQDKTGKILYQSVHGPAGRLTIRFNGIPVLAPGYYQIVVNSHEYSARQMLQVQ